MPKWTLKSTINTSLLLCATLAGIGMDSAVWICIMLVGLCWAQRCCQNARMKPFYFELNCHTWWMDGRSKSFHYVMLINAKDECVVFKGKIKVFISFLVFLHLLSFMPRLLWKWWLCFALISLLVWRVFQAVFCHCFHPHCCLLKVSPACVLH